MQNKIQCTTQAEFFDAIYQLTVRGLTFEANVASYTITLTGGY